MNLYDWFRSCEKIRIKNKANRGSKSDLEILYLDDSDNGEDKSLDLDVSEQKKYRRKGPLSSKDEPIEDTEYWMFLQGHLQRHTYETKLIPNFHAKVLNFIGGHLPRRDGGNQDYYCATMLTLFKPWRRGRDLKLPEESWSATFKSCTFTLHQGQVMNNINIQFECLDAKDDYQAQMKAEGTKTEMGQWKPVSCMDQDDQEGYIRHQHELLDQLDMDSDIFANDLECPSD